MNKKTWAGIVVIVIVIGALLFSSKNEDNGGVIKIGGVLPLSGDLAAYAEGSKNAATLAIEDSGLKDRVQFIVEDDKDCAPVRGVSAVQKLLNLDKVIALFGPMCSSEAESVLPLTEPLKTITISAAATSKTLSGKGSYFFRTVASNSTNANMLAEYIYSKGYKKAAFLYDNKQDAMMQEKNDARARFEKEGGVAVYEDSFSTSASDFKTQLLKIKESGAEVVFVASFPKEFALMLNQANTLKIQTQFAALDDGTNIKDFFVMAGKNAEGVYIVVPSEPTNEESKTFIEKYKSRFGINPMPYSAESYDAMMLLLKSIKSSKASGDSIKANLLKIGNNYQGASGIITFESNGDVIKPGIIKVAKDGQFVEVK